MAHSGTACGAMQDAIAETLTVAGYTVVKDHGDLAPFQMPVVDRTPPGPSWEDWLDERLEAMSELMKATHRRECDGE